MIGICAWFGIYVPFPDRLRMIRDAGFGSTALWWEQDKPEALKHRDHVPELVRNAGLHLDNLHVPYRGCNRLWSEADDDREASLEEHLGWVEDCARHEVPVMVMHVSLGNTPPPVNKQGIESLRRIVGHAENRDVRIAVENTRSDVHLHAVLEAIDSPALGLCYDSSHDLLYGDEAGELLRRWRDRLLTTHWSDTDGRRDRHWLPGEGVVAHSDLGFPRTYKGSHVLEVVPSERDEKPEPFLARAYASANELTKALT